MTAVIVGVPVRVSVCHCNACRLRTGGAFSAQARFPLEAVTIAGRWNVWERIADSGATTRHRWCPDCGGTIAYTNEGMEDAIAIPLGAIVEGTIPTPGFSMFEEHALPWVAIVGDGVVHD